MISALLNTLDRGLRVVSSNSRLLLIAALIFVFPLLFVWVTQNFYSAAHANIYKAQKERAGMVHDVLTSAVEASVGVPDYVHELASSLMRNNSDITSLRVYRETPNGMIIEWADNEDLIGTYDPSGESVRSRDFTPTRDFVLYEYNIDTKRTWEVMRRLDVDNVYYYTFSQHDYSLSDQVMQHAQRQSYYGLTAIFLFLIALAYWINRQTNWGTKYQKLHEQLEERDLFSNMIAHEFRAPLTAVKGYASFLQESQTMQPEEKRYVENIRVSAERLVLLVNDFLEVARLQSGKMELASQVIDVRELVIGVAEDLKPTAKEKGLVLSYDPGPIVLPVKTDKNRLTQVLINMINNAIKYTKEGSVKIACSSQKNMAVIRIMDTGMGISAEDQKKLFKPFERVGGVEDTKTTGTGLGMYITKKLIALLGGTIGIESIKGVGSHIVISLPLE